MRRGICLAYSWPSISFSKCIVGILSLKNGIFNIFSTSPSKYLLKNDGKNIHNPRRKKKMRKEVTIIKHSGKLKEGW